jgi:hypothetical protein
MGNKAKSNLTKHGGCFGEAGDEKTWKVRFSPPIVQAASTN